MATVRQFAEVYLKDAEAEKNKPSSLHSKRRILELYIFPVFGDVGVRNVTAQHILELKSRMSSLSGKSVNNALCVGRKLFTLAVEHGEADNVPVFRSVRNEHKEMSHLSGGDFAKLLVAAKNVSPECEAMFLLGGHAGLRAGEMLALKWSDIDFQDGDVVVRRAMSLGQEVAPKNNKGRRVPMSSSLVACLAGLKRHSNFVLARTVKKTGRKRSLGLDPMRATYETLRTWMESARKVAKLPGADGVHILRHTFCSLLAQRGVHVGVIRELAGHSDISITQRYLHFHDAQRREAVHVLD